MGGASMRIWYVLAALALLLPAAAAAQMTVGYDALGRVNCVRYPNGRMATYTYDAANNRTQHNVATGATCTSQTVGGPPSLPVDITTTNPSATINSDASTNWATSALGSSSDSATLTLVSASTVGGAGSCGTATVTSSLLTFTAPTVSPVGTSRVCRVEYVLRHPNGQRDGGLATVTVQGVGSGGGGDGGGGGGCVMDPRTGVCEIG